MRLFKVLGPDRFGYRYIWKGPLDSWCLLLDPETSATLLAGVRKMYEQYQEAVARVMDSVNGIKNLIQEHEEEVANEIPLDIPQEVIDRTI